MFILKLARHQLQPVLTVALSLMSPFSRIQRGEKDDTPRGLESQVGDLILINWLSVVFQKSCYTHKGTKFYWRLTRHHFSETTSGEKCYASWINAASSPNLYFIQSIINVYELINAMILPLQIT